MTDDLNSILVECAKLRNCYPLIYRTLKEFSWFVGVAMYGWTEIDDLRWENAGKLHHETDEEFKQEREEQKAKYTEIHERWKRRFKYDDDQLVELAKAFREYCVDEYGSLRYI